jgi:hypothetical protein
MFHSHTKQRKSFNPCTWNRLSLIHEVDEADAINCVLQVQHGGQWRLI